MPLPSVLLIFKKLKPVLPYAALIVVVGLYDVCASSISETQASQAWTELPLLVYLYALFRAPLRKNRLRHWVAMLPLLSAYVCHDYYLLSFGDVPDFADIRRLSELFQVIGFGWILLVLLIVLGPYLLWLWQFDFKGAWRRVSVYVLFIILILLALGLRIFPTALYQGSQWLTAQEEWSDEVNVIRWGRLYMALVREARRGYFLEQLKDAPALEGSDLQIDTGLLQGLDRKNVHIVVLESFSDVRRFTAVKFSQSPIASELIDLTGNKLGTSISHAFAGGTARSEFEVLCGVPSLALFGVEFYAFSGAPTYCLPNILRSAGYLTMASYAYRPEFYNAFGAYRGLGFEKILFGDRFAKADEDSIPLHGEEYIFDSDLYQDNLLRVKRLMQENRPILNYMLTVYGHTPYLIDPERHPIIIQVEPNEELLNRLVNQAYYRSQALAHYIKALTDLDPAGIIVLVADHLPPLPEGTKDYERLGYQGIYRTLSGKIDIEIERRENFLLVFADGKLQDLGLMRHFDLCGWIVNTLSHGELCRQKKCDFGRQPIDPDRYLTAYKIILGLASRPAP
jgi:phosphoglycerol transferase MdoB-like AlkP superfamily enzyme